MIIVGIDPGQRGGVSIIDTNAFKNTIVFPMADNSHGDIFRYLAEIRGGETHSRMELLHKDTLTSLKCIAPGHPMGKRLDTQMEIWLEEPGAINLPPTKGSDKSDYLTALKATKMLANDVGIWEGMGIGLDTTVHKIHPRTWQAGLKFSPKGKKEVCQNIAKSVFWHLTAPSGRSRITQEVADALLIGLYGYIQYVERKFWPVSLKKYLPET